MNLSKRETILISVLVGTLLIGTYIFYIFLPKYQVYTDKREKLRQNKHVLQVLQQLETSGQLEKEEQKTKSKWLKLGETIPSNMKIPTLYRELLNMRDTSNIKYQTLEFAIVDQSSEEVLKEDNDLAKVDINIVLSGTYEEVDRYLKSLYENQRKLVISRISYKTVEDHLEVSLMANGFALLKEGADQSEQFEFTEGKSYGKVNPYK